MVEKKGQDSQLNLPFVVSLRYGYNELSMIWSLREDSMKKFAFILLLLLLIPGCTSAKSPITNEMSGTYSLENPTEKQKLERLLSVTLYDDGIAWLRTPLISSYLLPQCTYSVVDDELLIRAVIETELEEGAYGVRNGDVIAKFAIADDKALVFRSAAVPLFADVGARYVYGPLSPFVNTVSIVVWKDNNGQTRYSLFDGEATPAPSELSSGRVFSNIAELNGALAQYQPDTLSTVHVKHTMDVTKDEMLAITDMITIPSEDYSSTTGLYEFRITTLDEAREAVGGHYPNATEIRYLCDDTISYTNPPAPVDVYTFEVDINDETVICAVSKERGIFFNYRDGTWGAFTGLRESDPDEQRPMTLKDVRGIAQKIGSDLIISDLAGFIGNDIGSGLYIMQYDIEAADYILMVGSADGKTVMYANLIHVSEGGMNESIDIRYYDVDKFILDETKALIRATPSPEPTSKPYTTNP